MEEDQQFCLRWNNHQSTLISVFDTLLENGTLVDCTLAAEGKFLKAHKVVLSACSPYFATLLSQQYDKHPIFILKDVKFQELRAMMDYMYRGEVNISQDQLGALLKAAESLQIKGLSDNRTNSNSTQKNDTKPTGPVSKSGLTIEQKRPLKHPAIDIDSDIAGSREGSSSPTSRKRKKVRRRSTDGNAVTAIDNHDHLSNSSSQSLPHAASTSGSVNNLATSVVNVTKKTELQQQQLDNRTSSSVGGGVTGVVKQQQQPQHGIDDNNDHGSREDDDDMDDDEPVNAKNDTTSEVNQDKLKETHSELLLEPKNEYDDGQDENVEDLTLEDEDLLDDLDHAGPSHGGESSSQGYGPWSVDRSQDEFSIAQEGAGGQHRDAQAGRHKLSAETKSLSSGGGLINNNSGVNKSGIKSNQIKRKNSPSIAAAIASIKSAKTLQQPVPLNIPSPAIGGKCLPPPVAASTPTTTTTNATTLPPPNTTAIITGLNVGSNFQSGGGGSHIDNKMEARNSYKLLNVFHPRIKYSKPKNIINTHPVVTAASSPVAITHSQPLPLLPPTTALVTSSSIPSSVAQSTSILLNTMQAMLPQPQILSRQALADVYQKITSTNLVKQQSFEASNEDIHSSIITDLENYAEIDDIELPDGSQIGFDDEYTSQHDDDQKHHRSSSMSLDEKFSHNSVKYDYCSDSATSGGGEEPGRQYMCRHCGKKYRWKSTLRRHENVECGGKEPAHQCPHCPYKAKQRGNLGVHIRKHHSNMPPLESRRKANRNTL